MIKEGREILIVTVRPQTGEDVSFQSAAVARNTVERSMKPRDVVDTANRVRRKPEKGSDAELVSDVDALRELARSAVQSGSALIFFALQYGQFFQSYDSKQVTPSCSLADAVTFLSDDIYR